MGVDAAVFLEALVRGCAQSGLLCSSSAYMTDFMPTGRRAEGLGYWDMSTMLALTLAPSLGFGLYHRGGWMWLCASVGILNLVTTAIAFLLIPSRLVALFTSDARVIADGVLYLRVISLAQIGQSFELILEGALAGAGYTFWPQIVSTSLTAMRIPLAAWWSRAIGLLGIWLALSVTAISRGVAMVLFWKGRRWRAARV